MKKYIPGEFNLASYAQFADECPLWSATFGLKLLEYIDYKPRITALDIGTGTGFPLTEIALRLGADSIVYGMDPWEEALDRARNKINFYKLHNIRLITGFAESIPLEDNSVDLITSNNGINNVSDADEVLSECSRILKPGGQFVQTFNLDRTMFEFYDEFERVLSELGMNDEIEKMHAHIREKRRPVDEMTKLLRKKGFMIRDLEHGQFNYRFSDGTTMLNHYFIRLAFMDSWVKLIPTYRIDEIFGKAEKRLNELSDINGGLKLSIPFVLINCTKSNE